MSVREQPAAALAGRAIKAMRLFVLFYLAQAGLGIALGFAYAVWLLWP